MGNLHSKFGHARPLGSRIIRYARDVRTDRQTDGRTKATLIVPFPTGGGIINYVRHHTFVRTAAWKYCWESRDTVSMILFRYPGCLHDFCRAILCMSAACAVVRCVSVCPSRSCILSKRVNKFSKFFHRRVSTTFKFFRIKRYGNILTETP